MIIITGASGFIGSALVASLCERGLGNEIVLVDDFYKHYKEINLSGKQVRDWVHRDIFLDFLPKIRKSVTMVFHLGARTDTFEDDRDIFEKLNILYSKSLFNFCLENDVPFYYASSAATYGDGSLGFSDEHELIQNLSPLNEYARSKQLFDLWLLDQAAKPALWAGFKFFNVFGPNEYHKKSMASVIFHAFNQIRENGQLGLFKSYRKEISHGAQMRDFIYIKDVTNLLTSLIDKPITNGIYNLGTGKAKSFNELGKHVFKAMGIKKDVKFIDMPEKLKDRYQYWTQAEMSKLLKEKPDMKFHSFEEGITDYVKNYLALKRYL